MKYFANEASGLNADIERHRREEHRLRAELKEPKSDTHERVYRHFLNELLVSKARVLEALGRRE